MKWRLGVPVVVVATAFALFQFFTPAVPAEVAVSPAETDARTIVSALKLKAERSPGRIENWQDLGAGYVVAGIQTSDPVYFPLAGGAFARADKISPDQPLTLVGRASLAVTLHQFDKALQFSEAALVELPYNTEALAANVDALVELGRYDEAAVAAQRLADRRPGAASLSRTSYIRELNGDAAGALAAIIEAEIAVSSSGRQSQAAIAGIKGDVYWAQGRIGDAERAYTRALSLTPNNAGAGVGLARVMLGKGEVAAAENILKESLAQFPTPGAAALLADLRWGENDRGGLDEMVVLYDALLALQREAGQSVDLEAALFVASNGDPAIALALAESAYLAQPNIFAADALAWAMFKSGLTDLALARSKEAIRLGTQNAELLARAAIIHAAAGFEGDAAELSRAAEQANPFLSPRLASSLEELQLPQ